jgi:hypothetical protein
MTPTCMEAFETLKLRLISAPCMVLHPEVSTDAAFIVAADASAVGMPLSYNKISAPPSGAAAAPPAGAVLVY